MRAARRLDRAGACWAQMSLPHILLVKASQKATRHKGGEINSTREAAKSFDRGVCRDASEETTCCIQPLEVRRGRAWASEHGYLRKK